MQYLLLAGEALFIELGGVLLFTGLLYLYEKLTDSEEKTSVNREIAHQTLS